MTEKVKIVQIDKTFPVPKYLTPGSAGVDLRATSSGCIDRWQSVLVPTGIKIQMPRNMEAQIRSRSGLANHWGVFVLNSPGTIDSDYTGEIRVILYNAGYERFFFEKGDRIAQMVFSPIFQPEFELGERLNQTERGDGGFGSTGV